MIGTFNKSRRKRIIQKGIRRAKTEQVKPLICWAEIHPDWSGIFRMVRNNPDSVRTNSEVTSKMALLGFRISSGMVRNFPDDPEWIRIIPDLFRTVRTGSGIFRVIPDDQFRAKTASFWSTYKKGASSPKFPKFWSTNLTTIVDLQSLAISQSLQ